MSTNVLNVDYWHSIFIEQTEAVHYDEINFGDFNPENFFYNLDASGTLTIRYGNNYSETITIENWSAMPISTFTFGNAQNKVSYAVVNKNITYDNGRDAKYISVTDKKKTHYLIGDNRILTGITNKIIDIRDIKDGIILADGKTNEIIAGSDNNIIGILGGSGNKVTVGNADDSVLVIGGSGNIITSEAGNNSFLNISGTSNSLSGGVGNDFLKDFRGQSTVLQGGAGDDILCVSQGNNQILAGNTGSDTYKILSDITKDTVIIIDQRAAGVADKDRLQLVKVAKEDVDFILTGKDLQIKKKNGGLLVIQDWYNSPLSKITFNNGTFRLADIVDRAQTATFTNSVVTYTGIDDISVLKGDAMYKTEMKDGTVTASLITDVSIGVKGGLQLNNVYGAYSDIGGDVIGNTLMLTNAVAQVVKGGYTSNGNSSQNNVIIKNTYVQVGAHDDSSAACIIGGHTLNGTADNNTVTMSGGEVNSIQGGRGTSGSCGNKVIIQDGAVVEDLVQAGRSSAGIISDNSIEMSSGNVRWLQAARCKSKVDNNIKLLNNKIVMTGGWAYSAIAADGDYGTATNNIVSISDADGNINYIVGAKIRNGEGNAVENSVIVNDSHASRVVGAEVNLGDANKNSVNISASSLGYTMTGNVYGGISQYGNSVENNVKTFNAISKNIIGGQTQNYGDASDNHVEIINSRIEKVYGGQTQNYGDAYNNSVIVENSNVSELFGGYSDNGKVYDNSVTVSGNSVVTNIWGGNGKDIVTVNGNSSVSSIDVGDGDDIITVSSEAKVGEINLGAGNDTLITSSGGNIINAGSGSNKITVNSDAGTEIIKGEAAKNIINVVGAKYVSVECGDTITEDELWAYEEGKLNGSAKEKIDHYWDGTLEGDTVTVSDTDEININGSTGNDKMVLSGLGSNSNIYISDADDGNDYIEISNIGFADIAGGNGDDEYVIDWRTVGVATIRNSNDPWPESDHWADVETGIKEENDTLVLKNVKFDEVEFGWVAGYFEYHNQTVTEVLRIEDKNNSKHYVDIAFWNENNMGSVKFDDVILTGTDINNMLNSSLTMSVANTGISEVCNAITSFSDASLAGTENMIPAFGKGSSDSDSKVIISANI